VLPRKPQMKKIYAAGASPQRIQMDVLIRVGTEDHFVPFEQVAQFEKALIAVRSVTTKIDDRASGGAEHCQEEAQTLCRAHFFDWMSEKFGDDKLTK
jgi:hypothetical protein